MTFFQEVKEGIVKHKNKVIINLLISVIISCIVAYYCGLSIYEKEGCSNSLSIIFNSGGLGFFMFLTSLFVCMGSGLLLSFMFEELFKGELDIDWDGLKGAGLIVFKIIAVIVSIFLVGSYLAGQILNLIIC